MEGMIDAQRADQRIGEPNSSPTLRANWIQEGPLSETLTVTSDGTLHFPLLEEQAPTVSTTAVGASQVSRMSAIAAG